MSKRWIKGVVAAAGIVATGVAGFVAFGDNLQKLKNWIYPKKVAISQFVMVRGEAVDAGLVQPFDHTSEELGDSAFSAPAAIHWPCPGPEQANAPVFDVTFVNRGDEIAILEGVSFVTKFFIEGGDVMEATPALGVTGTYKIDVERAQVYNAKEWLPISPPVPIPSDKPARIRVQLDKGHWFNSATAFELAFRFDGGSVVSSQLAAFECGSMF